MEIIVGSVFLLAGLAGTFGAFLLIRRSVRRLMNWKRTSGTVIGYGERRTGKGGLSYRPEVQFLSRGGRPMTFTSDVGSNRKPYQIGGEVQVLYDPDNIENAAIRSFACLWLMPAVATVFGGTFTAISINLLFFTKH